MKVDIQNKFGRVTFKEVEIGQVFETDRKLYLKIKRVSISYPVTRRVPADRQGEEHRVVEHETEYRNALDIENDELVYVEYSDEGFVYDATIELNERPEGRVFEETRKELRKQKNGKETKEKK